MSPNEPESKPEARFPAREPGSEPDSAQRAAERKEVLVAAAICSALAGGLCLLVALIAADLRGETLTEPGFWVALGSTMGAWLAAVVCVAGLLALFLCLERRE